MILHQSRALPDSKSDARAGMIFPVISLGDPGIGG
jgi:hypothetical protein